MSRIFRRWALVLISVALCFLIYYRASEHNLQFFNRWPAGPSYQKGPIPWRHRKEAFPVTSFIPLPTNDARDIPAIQYVLLQETDVQKAQRLERQKAVKDAFSKSWIAYENYAWMKDEILPLSRSYTDTFGGWGATLVDALDTLWIMGMEDEFAKAVAAVGQTDFTRTAGGGMLNVFETTIRYLGGLLAAHDLSDGKYPVLLQKAVELGDMLYASFDTPNRMPISRWFWQNAAQHYQGEAASFTLSAELGSLSLEFTRLSQITGDPKYYDAVQRISDEFARQQDLTHIPGLWPVVVDAQSLNFTADRTYTLGGMADSLYEYLPKEYLMLGGNNELYKQMYEKFADAAQNHLLFRPMIPDNSRSLLIAGKTHKTFTGKPEFEDTPEGQHLTCFLGGVYAIGAKIFHRPNDLVIAKKLVDGCIWAYEASPNGIAPEIFKVWPCRSWDVCEWNEDQYYSGVAYQHAKSETHSISDNTREYAKKIIEQMNLQPGFTDVTDARYILRPEAIESIFILYRITGDQKYQDIAWKMFTAIKMACETDISFAALDNAVSSPPVQMDSQESFWMAETLKYFYLIFSEPSVISLDDYVFNTEAHPLKRPKPAR